MVNFLSWEAVHRRRLLPPLDVARETGAGTTGDTSFGGFETRRVRDAAAKAEKITATGGVRAAWPFHVKHQVRPVHLARGST